MGIVHQVAQRHALLAAVAIVVVIGPTLILPQHTQHWVVEAQAGVVVVPDQAEKVSHVGHERARRLCTLFLRYVPLPPFVKMLRS